MEYINVYNPNLENIGIIDVFNSVIWTSRYYALGDFELTLAASGKALSFLKKGYFLARNTDVMPDGTIKNMMIVQNVELRSDVESGDILTVSGKSLGGLLEQRVISRQTTLTGELRDIINLVVAENLAFPSLDARKLSNLKIAHTSPFDISATAQVTGDNLSEWISALCQKYGVGYDVYAKNGNFIFKTYKGTDRSTEQTDVPQVVFSNEFENLLSMDYQYLTENFKNAAIVAGEGEGAGKIFYNIGQTTGLNRHELYVDAGSLSSNEGSITESEYLTLLKNKGLEALGGYVNNELFDGEADITSQYLYNSDFFMGDIVTIKNSYGISAAVRVVEVIESESPSGKSVIPTFSVI
jgi:hypothetical protein